MKTRVVLLLVLVLLTLPACLGEPALPRTPPPGTVAAATPPPSTSTIVPTPVAQVAPPSPTPAAVSTDTPTASIPTNPPDTATPAPPANTAPPSVASPTLAPPTVTAVATQVPITTPNPRPPTPSPRPATAAPGQITVLASGFGSPDDLAVDPRDGTIYFGDFSNNAVNRLDPAGGTPRPVVTGIREPEGIVVLGDGRLIVAEQATNRLLLADPASGAKSLLRQLVNTTGQDGVDGLGYDRANDRILIPDSPNGRLLSMRPDGSDLQTLATGFVRPTGAAVLPDGTILIADEFGNALYRLRNGRKSVVTTMYQPDDVVVDRQGIAYVNGLNGIIYRVDPATGRRTTLLDGLKLPHGLDVDPQGMLIVAEATRNRIFRLVP